MGSSPPAMPLSEKFVTEPTVPALILHQAGTALKKLNFNKMSRQTIINVAAAEVGTKESPPDSNLTKYGAWFGLNGEKWCAIFVSWVYAHAGYPLGDIDTNRGYSSCQSGYEHWKLTGELTDDPQMGDIVLFDWDGDGHCDHTGIFF